MNTRLNTLFTEYDENHQNPVNIAIHWFFEPLLIWALLAIIWRIPTSAFLPFENWVFYVIAFLLLYFAWLSISLCVGMTIVAVLFVLVIPTAQQAINAPLWQVAGLIFVMCWIALFLGHRLEGNKPSVFTNLRLLVIGPAWLLARIYRVLGI